jgi:hypothetical protein
MGVMLHVGVQKTSDHSLVLSLVLASLFLEEQHAAFAEGNCDLYSFVAKDQVLGARKEVIDDS